MTKCENCGTNYAFEKNLKRHRINGCKEKRICIKCSDCQEIFTTFSLLNKHLVSVHGLSEEKEEKEFDTYEAFLKWKKEVERDSAYMFVSKHRRILKDGSRKKLFSCHRSGYFISRSTGKKKIKSQGTNKINSICPSNMVVIDRGTSVHVTFTKNHYGHSSDIERCAATTKGRAMTEEEAVIETPERESEELVNELVLKAEAFIELLQTRRFEKDVLLTIRDNLNTILENAADKNDKEIQRKSTNKNSTPKVQFRSKTPRKRKRSDIESKEAAEWI